MSIKIKFPFTSQPARYLGTTMHWSFVSSLKTQRFPDGIVRTRRRGLATWSLCGRCRKKVSRCSCRLTLGPQLTQVLLYLRSHAYTRKSSCLCMHEHRAYIPTGILRDDQNLNTYEYIGQFSPQPVNVTSSDSETMRVHRNARMHSLVTNSAVIISHVILSRCLFIKII